MVDDYQSGSVSQIRCREILDKHGLKLNQETINSLRRVLVGNGITVGTYSGENEMVTTTIGALSDGLHNVLPFIHEETDFSFSKDKLVITYADDSVAVRTFVPLTVFLNGDYNISLDRNSVHSMSCYLANRDRGMPVSFEIFKDHILVTCEGADGYKFYPGNTWPWLEDHFRKEGLSFKLSTMAIVVDMALKNGVLVKFVFESEESTCGLVGLACGQLVVNHPIEHMVNTFQLQKIVQAFGLVGYVDIHRPKSDMPPDILKMLLFRSSNMEIVYTGK